MKIEKIEKQDIKKMVKIAVCLFLITTISTLLVAGVNALTEGPIAAQRKAKVDKAMAEVLPGAAAENGYQMMENVREIIPDETVQEVYKAFDSAGNPMGFCVKTTPNGYGGEIEMIVGVDMNGLVTGVSIVNMSETAGLGTKTKEEEWRNQFKGKGSDVAVTTSFELAENEVAAVSGATVSSKAVTAGVVAAVNAANQVKGAA